MKKKITKTRLTLFFVFIRENLSNIWLPLNSQNFLVLLSFGWNSFTYKFSELLGNFFIQIGDMSTYAVPDMPAGRWIGADRAARVPGLQLPNLVLLREGKRPMRVTVIGHSFITRIDRMLVQQFGLQHNFGVNSNIAEVKIMARGGMKTSDLRPQSIAATHPDLVYLEIGSNDLCGTSTDGPRVGKAIYNLAMGLVQAGVKKVVVGEIIYRVGQGIPARVSEYNYRVINLNRYLQTVLDQDNCEKLALWRHKGLWQATVPIYCEDGVHLNERGNRRLYRSIRGAIMKYLRLLDPLCS